IINRLLRFSGFEVNEGVIKKHVYITHDGDDKLSWALRHPEQFPVDLNRADYQMILRVPGIGVKSAKKIVQARRFGKIHIDLLKKLGVAYQRAKFFIRCEDSPKFQKELSSSFIRQQILTQGSSKYVQQLSPQLSLGF
ncbi:helix-hairpin-helix domain-containing protein, partial [Acinetobacter baumannii]|nr:helix-hairpin-helix domain-containing protein [Acinetobacter baumannii]